ncbi:hypothetical protein HPP92_001566 [Vanilla planifolia]|uniref:Peptidase M20 dimerisation domain-containing protein n=1 Tax=Vanilla planifolia TaxID=51239 RepID=A0A835RY96_VANPL|nr:hypothetical protein HPP92_001566 [Vanilla planifolia]
MDVVTADPSDWGVGDDGLSGARGLGDGAHAEARPGEAAAQEYGRRSFIANEENSSVLGIGVDALVKDGLLDKLKQGPLFWIDTADKQPCIGTGGMISWRLRATGKLFHSGLPHKAINPLELLMEALKEMQSRFYKDFPPHPQELVYGFATPSTFKPTQWSYPGGGINQIPGECTISGDVRLPSV